MAFNINAHVILSGPKNIKAVTKKIQTQLGSVSTSINLKIPKNISKQMASFNKGLANLNRNMSALQSSAATANAHLSGLGKGFQNLNASSAAMSKSQSKVQKSLQQTGKNVAEARSEIQAFGKDAALAIRRFSAFTVATGVVFGFVRAVQSATKAAIDYEREITKVVQVTGAGRDSIGKLKATIDDLSTSLGVDANELANLSRTFAQTGQSIDQVRASIRAVARSSLAPSFGEMRNTAEGLIAALAQFNIAARDSEAVLSSINAVSKKFAVESEDLISVIRRAGGVFSQAAGQFDDPKKSLNELIGIFTAVRSTTRESADTIAVGLRTIFTRIQRRGTIDFLKQFNIELQDAQGNFVGLFPAFQKLSAGLGEIIRKGDALTLSAITEELGGVRQVGKLIPAITQFNKALAATKIAGEAAKEGLGQDVALALQPLGKQFEQLQKRFMTLVRTISESKTFQNLAKVALSIGNAFLSVAETLKPLIPLMTTFAAIKISKGLFEFGKGFVGGFSKGGGAAGAGETLGGGISGGAARERRVADTGAQQALTAAVKSNTTAMGTNTTALQGVTSALQSMGNTITNTTTQMLGAVGNLINALNRGGGGFGAFGRTPKKFAKGGPVSGPSHAQGGVPAILEGGEYVIPKGYAGGGKALVTLRDTYGGAFLHRDSDLISPQGMSLKGQDLDRVRGVVSNWTRERGMQQGLSASQTTGPVGKQLRAILKSLDRAEEKRTLTSKGLDSDFAVEAAQDLLSTRGKKLTKADVKSKTAANIRDSLVSKGLLQSTDEGGVASIKLRTDEDGLPAAFARKELFAAGLDREVKKITQDAFAGILESISKSEAFQEVGIRGTPLEPDQMSLKKAVVGLIREDPKSARSVIEGYILEGLIASIGNMKMSGGTSTFDFRGGQSGVNLEGLQDIFGPDAGQLLNNLKAFDAKRTSNQTAIASIIKKKIPKEMTVEDVSDIVVERFATGGPVFKPRGTDTVPAMLTPGEFVINRDSAQKIGYGNLGKMNHLAKGGVASKGNVMQYFSGGGGKGWRESASPDPPDPSGNWWQVFIDAINAAGETLDVWDKKIQDSAIAATEKLNSVAAAAASAATGMAGGAAGAAGDAAGAAAGMAGSVGATLVGDASAMLAGFTNLLAGARKSWSDWLPDESVNLFTGKDNRPAGVPHGPELSPSMGKMVTESEAEDALKEASKNTATELDKYIAIMAETHSSAEDQAKAARSLAEAQQKEAEAADQLAAAQDQLTPVLLAKAAQIAKEKQSEAQTAFDKAKEDAVLLDPHREGKSEEAAATSVGLQNEITAALDEFQGAVMDQQATEEKVGADVAAGTITPEAAAQERALSEGILNEAQAKLAAAMDAKTKFYETPEGFLHEAGEKLAKAREEATAATAAVGAAGAEAAGGAGGGAGGGAPGAAMGDLVGGMGSAVAAVSGFTAAFASFDIQNPLTSIATLGMAADQAKDAMNMLGPAVSKFLPGLKQMVSGNSAASQAIDFFGKEIEGVKGAPKKAFSALGDGAKRAGKLLKSGISPMKALKVGLGQTKGSLLKAFNVNSMKGLLAKGLTGIPGLVTSLIAGPIVGAISGAISSAAFGEKEKIEGTNIEGFKGTGAAGGAVAGGLEAAGGAASAGLATAAMFGPVVGAIVAGGVLLKGAFVGAAKQVEFNAFKEMGKAVKEATGMLDKFNALSTVTPAAMKNLNDSIENVDKKFDKSFEASFARERTDQAFTVSGMLGKGGVAQEFFGAEDSQAGGAAASALAGVGVGLLATAAAATLAGTKIGALVGSFIPLPGAGTLAGAAIGATVGALVGLGMAMFSTDKSVEAAGKAFDKAAKQITPEFLENLDKAFQKTVSSMMDELAAVDPSLVQDFSDISTENMDLSASGDAAATNTAFEQMNSTLVKTQGALEGAGEGGKKFMSELNRMMALKVKLNLVDAVRTEAEFMDKESGDVMKQAFQSIKNSIDLGSTPEEAAAGFAKMRSQIKQMADVAPHVKTALLEQVDAQQKQNAESLDAAATAKVVEMRMREAKQAFDALAAGLDNFSNTTKGIADQLGIFVGNVKQEFDNLFSDSIQMDQVSEFNPFSNIDAASRSQIRGGMEQVRSLGGSAAGKEDPFKGMESLVAESKEIPFAIADALRELAPEAKGGKVDNSRVLSEIKDQLKERGIVDLPPQALAGLESTISGAMSRQGQDATVFSADALEKLLSEQGDVVKNIAALSEQGRAAMETAFEASQAYRNALLNVASLQQQMVEKERDMKLSMLDKEANVRDRINKALGHTPDVMESALSDLGGRLETMTGEVSGEGGMTTGVAGVANVFDVGQLTQQREDLQTKRDELRGQLGVKPGQIFDAESVDVSDKSQKEAAQKLGLVNAQLNGNTAALKELANDTRMLAAVEQQVADLQKKAIAAEQAAMGLAQLQIKLASGEISIEEFNKITKPLNTLTAMGKGQSVPLNDMSNLLTLINNKDPLVAAEFEQIISASTKKRQAAGETVVDVVTGERRQIEERDVEKEFMRGMKTEVATGAAATGDAGVRDKITRNLARSFAAEDAAEKKAASMGDVGDLQADAQTALFDSQKKGFEKIFADANQGLDLAVDKFGDAVDKFRELRGLGVNTEEAAKKVVIAQQKVQELKEKQAQAKTPEEKAKIGKELQDAQVELSQSKKNLEASKAKQNKEVEKGKHDVKVKAQDVESAKKNLENVKREGQVKGRAATMLPIATAAAESGEDYMANVAQSFKTPEGGKGAVNEERIRDVLGMGMTANAQFNENDTWGYNVGPEFMKETESLFADFSANIFGEGTQAAANFAKQMEGWRDATAAAGEDADHFMSLVEGGLPNALKAAAASDNASAEAVKAAEARLQTAQKEHAEASKKQEVLKESVAADKAARIEVEKGRVPATPAAQQRGSAAETATDLQQKEKAAAPPTAPARTVGSEEQKVRDRHREADESAQRAADKAHAALAGNQSDRDPQSPSLFTPEEEEEHRALGEKWRKRQQEKREKELQEARAKDQRAGTAATTSLPPALSNMTLEDMEQTEGMTAVDAAKHMEDKRTAQAKPADKAKAKPDFMKTKEENEADLQARQAEHKAKLDAKVKASPLKQLTTEDMKDIEKAKEPLNVDAAETQQKDVQTTLNAFRATAMKSADADIRKGAGSLFMGDAAGKKGEPTRKDRITGNIDKAKAKLAKLEEVDKKRDAMGPMTEMQSRVQDKIAEQKRRVGKMEGILSPDKAQLPVGVGLPGFHDSLQKDIAQRAAQAAAGQETLATTPPEQALAATGQTPPTTERDQQQGPQPQGPQAPGAPPAQVGEALSKGAVELSAALVSSAPEMAIGFVEGVKGNMEGVGKIIADEMKANLAGTDITISAKMGPITVQLTDGGGALQKMEKGFVGKMQEAIGTAINGLFNTDGSTKSKDTNAGMFDNLPSK